MAATCQVLSNSEEVAVEINLLYKQPGLMGFFFPFSRKKNNQTAVEWQVKKNCFDVYIKTGHIFSFPGWYIVQQLNNKMMSAKSDLVLLQDKCYLYSTLVKSASPAQNKCVLFHQEFESKTCCNHNIFL